MKVVHPICCGIDVHKTFLFATIITSQGITPRWISEIAIMPLCIIPGVSRTSAITIISEIGTDMSQFSNFKSLFYLLRLTTRNNESASKKESVRVLHAGVYLKPALVQVAHASVKSNNFSFSTKQI